MNSQPPIHPLSDVRTLAIGNNSHIESFTVIESTVRIGQQCRIGCQVHIDEKVVIADQVHIGHGVQIGRGVHMGPGVKVGVHATILDGLVVAAGSVIEPGSVVTHHVPLNAIVSGHPAVIIGYTGTTTTLASPVPNVSASGNTDLGVGGCHLYHLPLIPDLRGDLSVVEFGKTLPFQPKRCFWVFNVPSREVRGEHAHRTLHQYLLCLRGSIHVVIDDGKHRAEVALDHPNLGLHIPPLVWGIQYKYSPDAVLLVLASDVYDSNEYIRDYAEFIELASRKGSTK